MLRFFCNHGFCSAAIVAAIVSLRILVDNAAFFPDVTSPGKLFPEESHACSIACYGFRASWETIALVPNYSLKGSNRPVPCPWATAVEGMPVIEIPAVKYVSFMNGIKKTSEGSLFASCSQSASFNPYLKFVH